MSACKSPKTELIAIYRLEFYKKQKNWKFGTSRQEKKTSKKHLEKKTNLNITYNVQNHGKKETSDPLNVAFVDSESENTLVPHKRANLIKTRELSQEWQEPVNIWPGDPDIASPTDNQKQITDEESVKNVEICSKCGDSGDKPKRNFATQRLQELHNAAKLSGYEEDDNAQNILKESELYPQDIGNTYDYENDQEIDCEWRNEYYCDGFCDEDKWPMQSGLMIGAGHMAQEIWSGEPEPEAPRGARPQGAAPCCGASPAPGLLDTEECCDSSVDSVGEFMRGADAAPHSSEIELSLPAPVSIADVSFTSLSRLSSQQLIEAARLHSKVLKKLLLESEQRQRLRSLASLNAELNSFDEYPTRDLGPAAPLCPQGVFQRDVIVAGSHTHRGVGGAEAPGRGRGRLPDVGYRN